MRLTKRGTGRPLACPVADLLAPARQPAEAARRQSAGTAERATLIDRISRLPLRSDGYRADQPWRGPTIAAVAPAALSGPSHLIQSGRDAGLHRGRAQCRSARLTRPERPQCSCRRSGARDGEWRKRKKPLVVVTRKLPDIVETRMRELFDTRLNLDDKPMSAGRARRGGEDRRRAGADRHRPDRRRACSAQAGERLKLIANFGNGVDNIDVASRAAARHHRHQHAGRADRGHRRHDHGADPRRAAPARRRRERARPATASGPAGRRPGCSATASGGKRLGIIGMGRIGQAVARRATRLRPVRSTITTAAASRPQIEEELEATYWESLDQMLARMDIVSVNCPHTPATYHLLSARRLKLMRPDAYIVNTARGEVIDENALARMIEAGEIAGAGLDVFEHEPAVNPRLLKLARAGKVVLLPHMGSATHRGPHRHGREGHHQHQDLHGRPQAAGPRAAVHAVA